MREQRITLEYRVDFSLIGRNVIDPFPIEKDITGSGLKETSYNTQRCRFAAAGRAEQCEKFFIFDAEVNTVKNDLIVKRHGTVDQADELFGHLSSPISVVR